MSATALVILHDGVEELEAVAPVDILRRGGVETTLVAVGRTLEVTGRNGMILKAEQSLDTVLNQIFDAVVLPGGPGIPNQVRGDERVVKLLQAHAEAGSLTAFICAAPLIAHDAGLLAGKRFTAHFSVEDTLEQLDPSQAVIEDGTLITSRGAGTATAFSLAVLERLTDAATAQAVAESICLMGHQ